MGLGWECIVCGFEVARPLGICPTCGSRGSVHPTGGTRPAPATGPPRLSMPLDEFPRRLAFARVPTLPAIDAVLGGGLMLAGAYLLAGEPGIGKSTLLLQVAAVVGDHPADVLLVAGEEPAHLVAARVRELGLSEVGIHLMDDTAVESVLEEIRRLQPILCVVDSLSKLRCEDLDGLPGSPGQARESLARVLAVARAGVTITICNCHVTKDGGVAGPKDVEHDVDAVLWLEGDPQRPERTLRASKNRFAPTTAVAHLVRGPCGFVGAPASAQDPEPEAG